VPATSANVHIGFTVLHQRVCTEGFKGDVFMGQVVITLNSVIAETVQRRVMTLKLGDLEVSARLEESERRHHHQKSVV